MPSIIGVATAGGWQAATTLALPEGSSEGGLLLAWLSANDHADVTPPEGWTLVASIRDGDIGNNTGVHLYSRRVADSGEGPYIWGWPAEHWHHGLLVAVDGVASVRAHQLVAADGVSSINLPPLGGFYGDLLLAFGFHWDTEVGTEPNFATMDTVASQATILVAAQESLVTDGPTVAHSLTSAVVGRMAAVAVLLEPIPEPPAPEWRPIPALEELPPPSEWRFYAQDLVTGNWVHRELPLGDVKITPVLSGPYRITANIDPEYAELRTPSGDLVLSEWQTLIVAEASGQLRGGGILTDVSASGQKLELDITGVSAYAEAQPLRSTLTWGGSTDGVTGNGVDPLVVVRRLWEYLQDQPDGNLGVTLDSTTTPYRVGEWHNARRIEQDGTLGPADEVSQQPIPIDRLWDPRVDRRPVAARGKTVWWRYQLPWHEDIEIGQLITNLAGQTPFDWAESYRWANEDREAVVCHLHFGYPRLGRRLTSEVFREGENIADPIVVRRDGDDYANSITVYGAGEGSKKVRATSSVRDGRLRRAKSIDRPELTTTAQCQAVAADELRRWSQIVDITGFTVADHPNAPIGSFSPGDDVLVEVYTGWLPVRLWVRITSMTIDPEGGEVQVTCRRSDRFEYPKGA